MDEPTKRGLALSGGGFRATLFHLGVIRYLYDAEKLLPDNKTLSGITHITSVSGGSVIAAHLVLNWERYTGDVEEFEKAASEIISFIKADVRGRILRRIPLLFPIYWLSVFLRRTPFLSEDTTHFWTRVSTTDLLERYYSKHLFKRKVLADLKGKRGKKRPFLYLLTTNSDKGEQAAFTSKGLDTGSSNVRAYAALPLGRAVAASSAFPGMFPAVSCRPPSMEKALMLMDGGVYDNLGVKKFRDLLESSQVDFSEVIVSDASVKFKPASRRGFFEPITTPLRAADILFKRVYDFDKQSAIRTDQNFDCSFRFLSLRDKVDSDNDEFALLNEHQDQLELIRTDLDKFTELEIAALIRHGYCVARSKLGRPVQNPDQITEETCWDPVPLTKDKLAQEMIAGKSNDNAETISNRLSRSATRKFRLFSFRDPVSYLTVFILLMVLGYLLYPIFRLWLKGFL